MKRAFDTIGAWMGKERDAIVAPEKKVRASPSPGALRLRYAKQLREEGRIESLRDAKILINSMEMVGMKHNKALFNFTCSVEGIREKVGTRLKVAGFPTDVAHSVADGVGDDESVTFMHEDFHFNGSGGCFTKGGIWVQRDGDKFQVAGMLWGSSFDLAKHVTHYEERKEDLFQDKITYHTLKETQMVPEIQKGWFSDTQVLVPKEFNVTKEEKEKVKVGVKVTKIPIFEQKICTKEEFEVAQNFLAGQVAKEVLMLEPPKE